MDTQTSDRVSRERRWWLWSRLTNPRSPNRTSTMSVVGVVWVTGLRTPGCVVGSDDTGDDCGFV